MPTPIVINEFGSIHHQDGGGAPCFSTTCSGGHLIRPHGHQIPMPPSTVTPMSLGLQQSLQSASAGRSDLLGAVLGEKLSDRLGSPFKAEYWREQAKWNRYDVLVNLVARSTYVRSEDLIHCGFLSFRCGDRLFCPLCCFNLLARVVADEFGGSFLAAQEVYFVVISLSHNPDEASRLVIRNMDEVDFDSLNHSGHGGSLIGARETEYGIGFETYENRFLSRLIWMQMSDVVRKFTGNGAGGLFSGAVGGPELAVQLSPLRALPHANYICWGSGITIDSIRALRRELRNRMRDSRRVPGGLYPSVGCFRLRTSADLQRVIRYILKPIDLAGAYLRAVGLAGNDQVAIRAIENEVTTFMNGALDVFWSLRRVARYGRCHPAHRNYIGTVSEYRMARRMAMAERRAGCGAGRYPTTQLDSVARWERHHVEMADRPGWGCLSRFQMWRERVGGLASPRGTGGSAS